nr:immunoglobulin heavy chain junction region [Macaca mulatta]
CTTEDFW